LELQQGQRSRQRLTVLPPSRTAGPDITYFLDLVATDNGGLLSSGLNKFN
jgi:hypothetical protein